MISGFRSGRRAAVLMALVVLSAMWGREARAKSDDIVLGMSAAFSGPSQGLGIELWRGAQAYFDMLNANGGIEGRRVQLRVLDDGYDPERAIDNTIQLLEDDDVVALFSFVGTPTTTRVLPLMKLHDMRHGKRTLLFFPFTGAQPLRHLPYGELVFNLRASYREETEGLVAQFAQVGRRKIGIFYQADAYGRSGWAGVRDAAAKHDATLVAEATYRRGDGVGQDYSRQVKILRDAGADAVVAIGAYAACAGFIRDARDSGWDVPIANVSFVGSEHLLELLLDFSAKGVRDYTVDLVNSQVVPHYGDEELPAAREYRAAMQQFARRPPLTDSSYVPLEMGFASFEGFLNAKLMAEILRRADEPTNSRDLRVAARSIRAVDIGVDERISFSDEDRDGLEKVYFTTVENGEFVPLRDWSRWAR